MELSRRVKELFKDHEGTKSENPIILLISKEEETLNLLRNSGVEVSGWRSGIRDLIISDDIPVSRWWKVFFGYIRLLSNRRKVRRTVHLQGIMENMQIQGRLRCQINTDTDLVHDPGHQIDGGAATGDSATLDHLLRRRDMGIVPAVRSHLQNVMHQSMSSMSGSCTSSSCKWVLMVLWTWQGLNSSSWQMKMAGVPGTKRRKFTHLFFLSLRTCLFRKGWS